MIDPYTVVITSCGRFDLLERTLTSLLPHIDGPVTEIIIAEDSGNSGAQDITAKFGRDIRIIVNKPPMGQIKSIDRLYSEVATEWIFHCEDDWEFFRGGFIMQSFALLRECEKLSMVSLRDISDFSKVEFGPECIGESGIHYRVANDQPRFETRYCGIHFNPGLRRMTDYLRIGPYSKFGRRAREEVISTAYRDAGFRVGLISNPAVRHIGDGRHVLDPYDNPGIFWKLRQYQLRRKVKLRRSVSKRWHNLKLNKRSGES
ncbi:MAG: glycosyltransferase [Alphaproteobacteria bacterium]|nr:glycosyltransferase [Alphaproteobacteria bacterium]